MTEELDQPETSPVAGAKEAETLGRSSGPVLPSAELEGKLEAAVKDSESLRDQLKRKAAEFENYKRRIEAEFKSIIENATERLIVDLLPVLDDFDRFLQSSKNEKDYDALRKGVELISNKMKKILELRGLTTFESSGKPFDVHHHDALAQFPHPDVPPNTVIEEVNRGYSLNDKVIRHAKVVVSAPTNSGQPPTPDTSAVDKDGSLN